MATNKNFIVKNGIQVLGSTQSTSTDSGALIVNGGVGIGGGLFVGGKITATNLTLTSQEIALGYFAGYTQGVLSIAIGNGAGFSQGSSDIAIGSNAGGNFQSGSAIAIGNNAGLEQAIGAIAIGASAGTYQGASAIAIGTNANNSAVQPANSIVINANWADIQATHAGLYIAPIRADAATSATTFAIYYNPTTKELTTSTIYAGFNGGTVSSATTFNSTVTIAGGALVINAQPIVFDEAGTVIDTSVRTIDIFDPTVYRAAKYFISVTNTGTNQYQASEILLVHDGVNASIEQTSVFSAADNIVSFSAIISGGGMVWLRASGTAANNVIKVQPTYITV
jgi:hypothetical protein